MKLVAKKGDTLIRELTNAEIYVLKNTNEWGNPEHRAAIQSLENIYNLNQNTNNPDEKLSFLCDCNNNRQAIIVLCRRKKSGNLFTRRKKIEFHSIGCDFFTVETPKKETVNKKSDKNIKKKNEFKKTKEPNIQFYKNTPYISHKNDYSSKGAGTTTNNSQLGHLLYYILDTKKLNVLYLNPIKKLETYKGIEKFAKSYYIVKGKNNDPILLGDFFSRYAGKLKINQAIDKLKTCGNWPNKLKPYYLFLTRINEVNTHEIKGNICQTIRIENKVKFPPGSINFNSTTFLALFTLILSDKGQPLFQDAFVMPVSGDELIPVESKYEKDIFNRLKNIMLPLKIPSKIIKPLLNMRTIYDEQYRPDFIIKIQNKTIFIEILIFSGELYLKNKKRIKEIVLKECDHYFFINCVQQESINDDVKIIEKYLTQLTS